MAQEQFHTPTRAGIPQRLSGFASLAEALRYAARGATGCNFYDGRGRLSCALPYAQLLEQAEHLAVRLAGLNLPRGARVGILAETDPLFHRFFFACQLAGLIPVALPAGFQLGGGDVYVEQLSRLLEGCDASVAVAPQSHIHFLERAVEPLQLCLSGGADTFDALPPIAGGVAALPAPLAGEETAYLQYTSGSTQFPRAAQMTQSSILNNLCEIASVGARINPDDRLVSWLPFYHDMGLVGFVLEPMIGQLSVDYLSPRSFAMRPRLWLQLLSDNRGTVSSSPPFGYSLCTARVRGNDAASYDLSAWRMACVGAERIHPEPLADFAAALAPSGFSDRAFVACYGMAECGLAVSFAPLAEGIAVDCVDKAAMIDSGLAQQAPASALADATLAFVDCGAAMPSYDVEIRDDRGSALADRHCGRVCVRGPSVMAGYFENTEATADVLAADGWLDTGDIGYRVGDRLFLTARRKDVIIVNGRNLWPQDLEFLAEQVMDLRLGNVSAFSVCRPSGEDLAVVVVESKRNGNALADELQGLIRASFGIVCVVEIVPPRTLPRTSSGKLSRSKAKADYLLRTQWNSDGWPVVAQTDAGDALALASSSNGSD